MAKTLNQADIDLYWLRLRTRIEICQLVRANTSIPLERRVSLRDPNGMPLAVTLGWDELMALLEFQWPTVG